jgi:hypothetical protein
MSNTNIKSDPINRDVLWGVDEISRCIGREPQATSRMLRLGYLPAFKVGDRWTASVSKLRRVLNGDR